MNSKDELVYFLREQIHLENKIVSLINSALLDIRNPVVEGVLKGISLDSMKHAEMYAAAIELLVSVQGLTRENHDKQKEHLENHIRIEAELIKRISEIIPSVEHEKVGFLLNEILLDEKRHHDLLKKVLQFLIRGEIITEDERWDILWKSALFHGAPGG